MPDQPPTALNVVVIEDDLVVAGGRFAYSEGISVEAHLALFAVRPDSNESLLPEGQLSVFRCAHFSVPRSEANGDPRLKRKAAAIDKRGV
jgi:hypothetical protein